MSKRPGVLMIAILMTLPAWSAPALQQIAPDGSTEVTLYTGSAAAMVRQYTPVRLNAGANTVSFGWTADGVDAASVTIAGDRLQVGPTITPAGAERTLQWAVTAPEAGEYALTTTFLLNGLTLSPAYRMDWAEGAGVVRLRGWVGVLNESGMGLEDVQAQLVVGRPGSGQGSPNLAINGISELSAGMNVRAEFLPSTELAARTLYRIDSETAPERVMRVLEVQPPRDGALGREMLPPGPMHLVIGKASGPDRISMTTLSYEPGEEFEVALGQEQALVVERRLMERRKEQLEFDRLGQVSGFDTVERYELAVRSYLDRPADIEIVETVLETWEMQTDALHVLEDREAIMRMDVPAGGESTLGFTLVKHTGTRIPK